METEIPETLMQAVRYFADPAVCNDYMRRIKWPDGKITCPHCGAKGDRIGEIATRHMNKCKACGAQFSDRLGTIFSDSPLTLGHWFAAIWSEANEPVSSIVLGEVLDVGQKTANAMQRRIRIARALTHSRIKVK